MSPLLSLAAITNSKLHTHCTSMVSLQIALNLRCYCFNALETTVQIETLVN